jgi:ElaB/YqjD/DUF883 family membrane-anchored ribosome-binding protein
MSADEVRALARAEADIHRTREKVALSVTALQRELARSLDWRQWVGRKPFLAVGLAFGLGLLLGRRRH